MIDKTLPFAVRDLQIAIMRSGRTVQICSCCSLPVAKDLKAESNSGRHIWLDGFFPPPHKTVTWPKLPSRAIIVIDATELRP